MVLYKDNEKRKWLFLPMGVLIYQCLGNALFLTEKVLTFKSYLRLFQPEESRNDDLSADIPKIPSMAMVLKVNISFNFCFMKR
jgi:hypothetical protein